MLTKHNCKLVQDTALVLECLVVDVFYLSLAGKGGEVDVAKVNQMYSNWMENKTIPTIVQDFCLDILAQKIVILDQYKYLKAKRREK